MMTALCSNLYWKLLYLGMLVVMYSDFSECRCEVELNFPCDCFIVLGFEMQLTWNKAQILFLLKGRSLLCCIVLAKKVK